MRVTPNKVSIYILYSNNVDQFGHFLPVSYWSTGSEKLRKPPDLDFYWLGGFSDLEEINNTTPTSLNKEQAASQSTFIIRHPILITVGMTDNNFIKPSGVCINRKNYLYFYLKLLEPL